MTCFGILGIMGMLMFIHWVLIDIARAIREKK